MANRLYIDSDTLVKGTGLYDNKNDNYENAATVKVSVCEDTIKNINEGAVTTLHKLAFTSGGTEEIEVGDVIQGDISAATATVEQVEVTGGSWGAGTAAGDLHISNQVGTFVAEDLDVLPDLDLASIAGDSTKDQRVKITATDHDLDDDDWIRICETKNYEGNHEVELVIDTDNFILDEAYVAETFKGTEEIYKGIGNGKEISMPYIAASDGDYRGTLPDTLVGLQNREFYWLFFDIDAGGDVSTPRVHWQAVYYREQEDV